MKICAASCGFGVAITLCSFVSYFGNVEVEGGWKFWTACPGHEDGELWGMVYQSSRLDMINQRHVDPSSVSEDQFSFKFDVFWQATIFMIFYR